VVAGLIAVALSWPGKALPQTASPEAVAAAKELMIAAKMTDQVNLMLAAIMEQLRPLIVKGDSRREREFDALMPKMVELMQARMEELLNANAQIYARHFTAEEMRQLTDFYRTPAGVKLLQKQPEVFQESTAFGQKFGAELAKDAYARMTEELGKRTSP
jgi:hypothetical protein